MSAVEPNGRLASPAASGPSDDSAGVPRLSLRYGAPADDALLQLFGQFCRFVLQHPVAAQAIFSAFVAEGRRFAQTPEGQRWKAALADSELVRKGRALWEGSVLNLLEDHPSSIIPSAIFDAVVHAANHPDLMSVLQRGLPQSLGHGSHS